MNTVGLVWFNRWQIVTNVRVVFQVGLLMLSGLYLATMANNLCDSQLCACARDVAICVKYPASSLRAVDIQRLFLLDCDRISLAAVRRDQDAAITCVDVS